MNFRAALWVARLILKHRIFFLILQAVEKVFYILFTAAIAALLRA